MTNKLATQFSLKMAENERSEAKSIKILNLTLSKKKT